MTAAEYNKCVTEHADALYRFILKSIQDSDKAKDIIQDTYEPKLFNRISIIQVKTHQNYNFDTKE